MSGIFTLKPTQSLRLVVRNHCESVSISIVLSLPQCGIKLARHVLIPMANSRSNPSVIRMASLSAVPRQTVMSASLQIMCETFVSMSTTMQNSILRQIKRWLRRLRMANSILLSTLLKLQKIVIRKVQSQSS